MNREEEQFNLAFGEQTGISDWDREKIGNIKDNNDSAVKFSLHDAELFTDLAWKLLGRYIANNNHLREVWMNECNLTNQKMSLLFGMLVNSSSLKKLEMRNNPFGIDGMRCMVPFLNNSNLESLHITGSWSYMEYNESNFCSECFDLVISSLHDKSIQELWFMKCRITDISSLGRYTLPNLQKLYLDGNRIGTNGCKIIADLLQKEGSTLTSLYLESCGIDDEGAEILATSLISNTKLTALCLKGNRITERGRAVFLKPLVDISSIENSYNSNHTLVRLKLVQDWVRGDEVANFILGYGYGISDINKDSRNSHAAGRAKIIKYQLNSQTRRRFCELQGVDYSAEDNMLVGVEPKLLPDILALVGNEHGQSEFYTSLLPVAPDLLSFIDRKATLNEEKDRNLVKVAALTRQLSYFNSKINLINERLALIDLIDNQFEDDKVRDDKEGSGGKKRQRISGNGESR